MTWAMANWKLIGGAFVLWLLLRPKSQMPSGEKDDCSCAEYGTPENLAMGGLKK